MNSSPALEEFLTSVRKSTLVKPTVLDPFLDRVKTAEGLPKDPVVLARKMLADGLVTKFQAEQLLQNRWRNFELAGKYRILERISSGQMSSVFLCEHITMKRLVALKMLPGEKAKDPASLARFHREARAAARLKHPNVVAIHDLDSAGGLHFLVAEYVDGNDLNRVVGATGPMTIARAADCIRQAADGLQHAHEMGMVHRDIKPGNLLLDRAGVVKLLDLGLARLFLDESDGMTKLDDGRMLLGTIDYLSPEQAQDSHDVDIRADIYSLGATAFFLLSGRTLFDGASTAQKLVMHGHRPVEQIVRELSGIPRGFADIVVKMLAKDPADRYQTPAEVSEAMAPWAPEVLERPSAAEMPKLCTATRKVVEHSQSKAIRIPNRPKTTSASSTNKKSSSVSTRASLVLARLRPMQAKAKRMSPNQVIGLGLTGLTVTIALGWWALSGSGNKSPITPTPNPSKPGVAALALPGRRAPASTPTNAGSVPAISEQERESMLGKANTLASANRWVEAGAILRQLIDTNGSAGAWHWLRLTLLDLQSNNLEQHRLDCELMLAQFGNTSSADDAERVVKCCLLAVKPIQLEQAAALSDRVLANDTGEFAFWSRNAQALVSIRKGAYDEALAYLADAERLNTGNQTQALCLTKTLTSILQSKKKRPDLAKVAYEEATKIMREETERGGAIDYSHEWHNWYSCAIALHEADTLLRFPPK